MEQTQLTAEQIESIGKAFQAIADALRNFWEMIVDAVRKAAKILAEIVARFEGSYHRTLLYYKLRSFHVPHIVAYWIAKLMPRKLLLMY